MSLEWRNTLKTLTGQFQARASTSPGLHHLFTEVAEHERDKLVGPQWFAPWSDGVRIVDGKPQFEKWSVSRYNPLPWISPGFREPVEGETFADDDSNAIRDKSGVVRAVSVPMKLRTGYYCGRPSDDASAFRSLADVAAAALAGAKDLREHAFATDLTDLFRKPRGGIRYIFGDVPDVPNHFTSQGWAAGVWLSDNGVLIDLPIAESKPDADHWLVLLHRLGWHRIEGSGLQAQCWCWNKNVEVAREMLLQDASQFPKDFSNHFNEASSESFYSVIGTKDAPLDINLASVFAIDLLLADLASKPSVPTSATSPSVDYSNEKWHRAPTPKIRATKVDDCKSIFKPQIGVLVATKVEQEALLKRMRPPERKRSVIQTHVDSNTYFLGRLGTANIVACMTAMGSVGRDSSTLVTTDLIRA